MMELSKNWLVEPVFDYEYKSYQVLAYTSRAHKRFDSSMIFPYLADIHFHIKNLNSCREGMANLESEMKSDLVGIDVKKKVLIREGLQDDTVIQTLQDVAGFACDKLSESFRHGLEEKERIKELIQISPVGIIGPSNTGGLLFLSHNRLARIYKYQYRMIRRPHDLEVYKDVVTEFVGERSVGLLPNFQKLKMEYVSNGEYNTYLVECKENIPVFETVIPLTKEYLLEENA
jgi:hypothetical protein